MLCPQDILLCLTVSASTDIISPMKRATRADVAVKAGVSKTTVTYALGNRYEFAIPEETRDRVRVAAKQLGYFPHPIAQALTSGRTNSITVAFPDRIGAHYSRVLQAFERATNAQGYHMIASTVGHVSFDNAALDLNELLGNLTDGIVLVDMPGVFQSSIDALLPSNKPIVSMGVFTVPGIDGIQVDLRKGTAAALQHLLQADPARLAFFGPRLADGSPASAGTHVTFAEDARPSAYREAMTAAGRPWEEIAGHPSDRKANMESLWAHIAAFGCPDALFCFNDDVAMSAYRALRETGYRIPQDVLVVGCDGSEEAEYAFPALTTIVQPIDRMCSLAWEALARRLHSPGGPEQQITVDSELAIRASSIRTPKNSTGDGP